MKVRACPQKWEPHPQAKQAAGLFSFPASMGQDTRIKKHVAQKCLRFWDNNMREKKLVAQKWEQHPQAKQSTGLFSFPAPMG